MTGTGAGHEVLIIGGGICGLTLGLRLHEAGIACRVFEAAAEIKPLGVGINLLPHATRELAALGLESALAAVAVTTREIAYYNRFGQFIHSDPSGRFGGYAWPQFSIHRGDLHMALLDAFVARAGADRVVTAHRCAGVEEDADGVVAHFTHPRTGERRPSRRGAAAVGCEGIHSAIRKQFFPAEGPPRYSGVNMWRGVTRAPPFLTGASMVRIGWLRPAKVLIYPIRDAVDAEGRQLINWVCDIEQETPPAQRDWNRPGRLADFIPAIADWHFPWLDVAALCRAADQILEFPMVDQDPLPRWSHGRVTLAGDAAHPMLPRGANGAAQAILDAGVLAEYLRADADVAGALRAYEAARLPPTSRVVLANRENPPDAILRTVYERTGDRPFRAIEDVVSAAELAAMSQRYQRIAGFDHETLAARDRAVASGGA
ncbi:MAG: flavin-dependent oxidoreductase [Proteobacteria bacterium]|nr:flavin-dependent oxidoreductase [Pseudomonadota bacterium]